MFEAVVVSIAVVTLALSGLSTFLVLRTGTLRDLRYVAEVIRAFRGK